MIEGIINRKKRKRIYLFIVKNVLWLDNEIKKWKHSINRKKKHKKPYTDLRTDYYERKTMEY